MKRISLIRFALVMLILVSLLFVASASPQEKATTEAKASLYDRLGGIYSIASVVDEFLERLLVNDILNANPMIKNARDMVPKAGLKFRLSALICQLAGGPEVYNGRTMKDAHVHLNISNAEWDEMVKVFVQTLTDFKVPQAEQDELLALVGPTKGDIVTATE